MNSRQLLKFEKRRVARLKPFRNRCFVCWKPFGKFFNFHHLEYDTPSVISSDYKDNTKYQLDILPFVVKNPKQFMLTCKAHHYFIGWGASIKDMAMWKRYLTAVRMTRNGRA